MSVVQDPEQLHLCCRWQFADLIEENGPPIRLLEVALSQFVRAGERVLFMAEELGLDERGRDSSAVHDDRLFCGAETGAMDGPSEELLAGAGLALDKDGHVAHRCLAGTLHNSVHDAATVDDVSELGARRNRAAGLGAQLRIRGPQELGQEIGSDVEGHLDCPDPVVLG